MKKVVVLGSNSFSGSHFVDLLLAGGKYDVVGISRSKEPDNVFLPYKRHKNPAFRFHQYDLNHHMDKVKKFFDDYKPDCIVNFSALVEVTTSWKVPEQYFQTNTMALVSLAHHLTGAPYLKRFVQISTPEVYGACDNATEDQPIRPSSPYAAAKAAGDLYLMALAKQNKFPVVIIRSTNVYGPGQQLFRIVPRTIGFIKMGKHINLHGGGKSVRSYIHIRDISEGEKKAMEQRKNGEIYHLSPTKGIMVRDLVKLICERMGKDFHKVVRVSPDRPGGQDKGYVLNSEKASKVLSWKSVITLSQGIDDVIGWMDNNWPVLKNMPFEYQHKP